MKDAKSILEKLSNNKKISWASPMSIVLIEWLSYRENKESSEYYSWEVPYLFHKKSVSRLNSTKHYLDYKTSVVWEKYHDGRYYDDLDFKEELNSKPVLIDSKKFFTEKMENIDSETINKLLWIINEIERNIRNHAYEDDTEQKMKRMSYCANFYLFPNSDTSNRIIINISDFGIGFEGRKNVNRSYAVLTTQENFNDESFYLLEALKKNITTFTNAQKVSNDENKNSGYGLYLLNEIASHKSNKLEILSDGELFVNDFHKKKMKHINKFENMNGITSITFDFAIDSLKGSFEKLENEVNAFSSKSNYSKSKMKF